MYVYIILFSSMIFIYSVLGKRIKKMLINGPLLFVLVGIIFGPLFLNLLDFTISGSEYENLINLALAVVLFTGASKINFEVFKSSIAIPSRLLLIGLPLTIVFGLIAGMIVFNGFLWVELAILATVLAPTDAALGEAVVTNQAVPPKVREALNVESGLNDGISVPIFLLLLALYKAGSSVHDISLPFALGLFAKEIGIGLLAGIVVMFLGAKLLVYCEARKWIAEGWKPTIVVALAFTCFSLADVFGGSGFIACFSGGFIYGAVNKKYKADLQKHAEGLGNVLTFLIWFLFGSIAVSTYAPQLTWQIFLYAILSLTIVRIIPVIIALIKRKLSLKEKLFIGWFGPRGLASIVFAIMLLDIQTPHEETIITTILCTVFLSVVLHGITANPLISLLNMKKPDKSNTK
jgi:NhaP-type Na+/H+ or K+/H+ antiporter